MAFPVNPQENDEHVENERNPKEERFYCRHGKWRKRRFPEHIYKQNDNVILISVADIAVPYNVLTLSAAFEVTQRCNVDCVVVTDLSNTVRYHKARGYVSWGDGGAGSTDWNWGAWRGTGFSPTLEDASRDLKANRPQRMIFKFMRSAPFGDTEEETVLSWETHTTCVTGNDLIHNYGIMNLTDVPMQHVDQIILRCTAGGFASLHINAQTF